MKISFLKTFIETVKTKNLSRSAKNLYLSQPAVSKQIQTLEKYYQTKIFVKNGNGLELTEDGEKIYTYALDAINLENELMLDIDTKNKKIEGEFNLCSSNIPMTSYLPYIIPEFLKKYNKAMVNVVILDTSEVIKEVKSGKESFGFIGKYYEDDTIGCLKVFESEIVLAGSKNFEVSSKSLKKAKFIVREKGSATRASLEKYLKQYDVLLDGGNIAITLKNNDVILKMLKESNYLAILPRCEVEKVSMAVLEICEKKPFYYIYNKRRYMSALETEFHKFIQKTV